MNPNTPTAALLSMLAAAGLLLLWHGATRRERPTRPAKISNRARQTLNRTRLTPLNLAILAISVIAGLIYAARSGFWAVAILIPALAWGLPLMLKSPSRQDVERLDGLSQWIRRLAGLIASGRGLRQTLITSLDSAPKAIEPQIRALANRLRNGLPTEVALYRLGDDLADPVADKAVAALIKASTTAEASVASLLNDVAQMISDEVQARQQIATAQTAPRTGARIVSMITTAILLFLVFVSDLGAAYHDTLLGQVVLVVLSGIYALLLWWIRSLATPAPAARFIQTPAKFLTLQGVRR